MDELVAALNEMPFAKRLGIEVTEAAEGNAEARLELDDWHSSTARGTVAHGGVTYSLADSVGGAAVISLNEPPTPTIDMRIDYLAPVTTDLEAEATVLRDGGTLATAEVTVFDAEGTRVADAHGVYKTSGADGETPWESEG